MTRMWFGVTVLLAASVGAPARALASPQRPAAAGDQQWASVYDGPGHGNDKPASMVISPDGSRVYVTGQSWGGDEAQDDFATVAYDRTTGAPLWEARYDGPGTPQLRDDEAVGIAISPDGTKVFVTGSSYQGQSGTSIVTIAYDAAAGTQGWLETFSDTGSDVPIDISVSPDGSRVFVTGQAGLTPGYLTLAYSAASGTHLWQATYFGVYSLIRATGIATSPDGSSVYVTGFTLSSTLDMTTVSYDAVTGTEQWETRYDGGQDDVPRALAVTSDGSSVLLAGYTGCCTSQDDMETVSLDAATGAELWASMFAGPAGDNDQAIDLAINPGGTRAFVTGWIDQFQGHSDFGTVAYDVATGEQQWVRRYAGDAGGEDVAQAIAASPDGTAVYVTGASQSQTQVDFATVAYRSTSGQELWVSRFDGATHGSDRPKDIAITPDGRAVVVTGFSGHEGQGLDYATVSYRGA